MKEVIIASHNRTYRHVRFTRMRGQTIRIESHLSQTSSTGDENRKQVTCILCNAQGPGVAHHTSYLPERTVELCYRCHSGTVHKNPQHPLHPRPDLRTIRSLAWAYWIGAALARAHRLHQEEKEQERHRLTRICVGFYHGMSVLLTQAHERAQVTYFCSKSSPRPLSPRGIRARGHMKCHHCGEVGHWAQDHRCVDLLGEMGFTESNKRGLFFKRSERAVVFVDFRDNYDAGGLYGTPRIYSIPSDEQKRLSPTTCGCSVCDRSVDMEFRERVELNVRTTLGLEPER